MAALKRTIDLSGADIQQAWQDVRNDAAETNWYSRLIIFNRSESLFFV
jgi:hypothetical protein